MNGPSAWSVAVAVVVTGCAVVVAARGNDTKVEAVKAYIAGLSSNDAAVRLKAATALGQLGPAAKEAVPALRKTLGDPEVDGRRMAADALGQVGPDAKEAIPELREMNKSDIVPGCRRTAVWALGPSPPRTRRFSGWSSPL